MCVRMDLLTLVQLFCSVFARFGAGSFIRSVGRCAFFADYIWIKARGSYRSIVSTTPMCSWLALCKAGSHSVTAASHTSIYCSHLPRFLSNGSLIMQNMCEIDSFRSKISFIASWMLKAVVRKDFFFPSSSLSSRTEKVYQQMCFLVVSKLLIDQSELLAWGCCLSLLSIWQAQFACFYAWLQCCIKVSQDSVSGKELILVSVSHVWDNIS